MINKVILLGHVGQDPEVRPTKNGGKFASFRLATSEYSRDKATGERKQTTEWHSVVVFDSALVEIVEKYVHKGSRLYVEGAQKTRKWTKKDGTDVYSTETVLSAFRSQLVLMDKSEGRPAPDENSYGTPKTEGETEAQAFERQERERRRGAVVPTDLDDEIPF
jgi:single-strand DNA-binding protein